MRPAEGKWSLLLGLTVVAALSVGATTLDAAQPRPPEDSGEVRARVEAYERVWNTRDPAALGAFFTPDADMLMGNGPRIRGRDAIEAWWATYFSRIDPGRGGSFTIDSIRLITPTVALVNVDTRTAGRDAHGQELPARLARGTWVMVRQGEEWLVSAMRGQPAEGEERTSPGRDR